MSFIVRGLIQLTGNFLLLMKRHRQIEARLKRLEDEVKALRQQRP